ncbi:MAG: peptidoglycan-binding protein [Bacteroidetes bacterium]|nr:peptidoglycan-binding protein [Bacteroidota bacterium]
MFFDSYTSFCAAIFFAFVPALSEANSSCTKAAKSFNLCKNNGIDQKIVYQNNDTNVDAMLLYYSGGILQNGPNQNEVNTLNYKENNLNQTDNKDLDYPIQPDTTEDLGSVYDQIKNKFAALSNIDRKNVQKCLRYGSYTGKIDGLWGNQTFQAIKNFRVNSSNDSANEKRETSIFAKIKNIFSLKKSCYALISKNFKT